MDVVLLLIVFEFNLSRVDFGFPLHTLSPTPNQEQLRNIPIV